ncbi:MAG: hypothetical protein OEZ47_16320 [Gammaproteobacteria bacterium]|nr:hypothetical protein [Gammaproteobacteria bacterium]
MTQQINLLKDEFRPRRILFSLKWSAVVVGLSAVAMLFHLGMVYLHFSNMAERAERAQSGERQIAELFKSQKEILLGNVIDPDIDEQIENLKAEVEIKTQLKTTVQRALSVASGQFSPYLLAFADHYKPELWLENIFFHGNEQVLLKGYAVQTSDLVSFIDRLSSDSLFLGRSFDVFQLKKEAYIPPEERVAEAQDPLLAEQMTAQTIKEEEEKRKLEKREQFFAFSLSAGIDRESGRLLNVDPANNPATPNGVFDAVNAFDPKAFAGTN